MKGLRKRCDLSDRGVRFGMVHAKDAKGGMGNSDFGIRKSEIIFCRDVGRILLNYLALRGDRGVRLTPMRAGGAFVPNAFEGDGFRG